MTIIYRAHATYDNKKYIYIGKTNRTLAKRKKEHEKSAFSNEPDSFHQEMRKIPLDDWIWELLFSCDDSDAIKKEKEVIAGYREEAKYSPNIKVLNDTSGKNIIKQAIETKPNYGIPKARKQRNYAPSEMGEKFARISGKLKPIINLQTQKIYRSILEAEKKEKVARVTITNSCNTGRKLPDGTQYACLDLDDNPILKQGHSQNRYIGRNARKIKELTSGQIYNNAIEVANKYNLSSSSVSGLASGKYSIAKGKYVFCYLDENNNEIRTKKHDAALRKINKKEQINYVAWPIDFFYEDAKQQKLVCYFKTFNELYKNLNIKNRSHTKAVCDGKRSHVEGFRIAYYEDEKPILTARHLANSKKIIRKVQCLNDQNIFNNCTEAGYKYSVEANSIGLCAKGILKSVRVKNKDTGKIERFRFAYLDKSNKPILKTKHYEPLLHRKGISKISLINQDLEIVKRLGKGTFSSLAEFCRETGVPAKRARKYLNKENVEMLGYEFVVID